MARFYVEKDGEWNIFSTVVDDFLLDEFVCLDALKARLLYERYKELTEDIDSLLTDRPNVNVMTYEEAVERIRKDEPQREPHECVKTKKKPCSACKYYDWEVDEHIGFREVCYNIGNCEFKKKTEPQNDCEGCKHYVYQLGCTHHANCAYEPKDEPQTDCPWK